MDHTKDKIRSLSSALFFALLIIAGFMVVASTHHVFLSLSLFGLSGAPLDITGWAILAQSYLLSALLVHMAFIFKKISKTETPFTKAIPRRMKIAALGLFLALAVPHWVGYLVFSMSTGTFRFVLFGESEIFALAMAAIVYCMAQIFDYGFMLQDESYEIL